MANTALNVSAGKPKATGGIYRAPLGTALPTDASTALSASFTSLGYIAQGGVTHSFELDTGDYRAWGGDLVLSYLNSKTHTFAFGLIEAGPPHPPASYSRRAVVAQGRRYSRSNPVFDEAVGDHERTAEHHGASRKNRVFHATRMVRLR